LPTRTFTTIIIILEYIHSCNSPSHLIKNVTEIESSRHVEMLPLFAGSQLLQQLVQLVFEFDHIQPGMNGSQFAFGIIADLG
jgi:hypothetical protein